MALPPLPPRLPAPALSLDTKLLTDIGLGSAEALLYRLLLHAGPKRGLDLSKLSGITRTNTYNVLSQLELKGLIERQGGGRKTLFAALHPSRLERFIDHQEQVVRSSRDRLKTAMQDLVADFSLASEQQGVFRFEGKDGMIRVYEELIKDRMTVHSIVDRHLLRDIISDYNPEYIRKRIRNKIHSRVVAPATGGLASDDIRELREVRYLDPKQFPFHMDLKVTEKKVVMTTFERQNIVGIIMIEPAIIRNYLVLFEFLWSIGKTAEEASERRKNPS